MHIQTLTEKGFLSKFASLAERLLWTSPQ